MLTLDAILRTLKMESALGSVRDSFSQNYACRRAGAVALSNSSYKIKIEYSKASNLETRQEYLHPNFTYY
ncbi:MAG TPA: hypothetical protein VJB13_00230 [Candidatus Nanoarchaeia archaeon]|nr:hypothetical protein [Candidatus Nanoarchaeia archaeon]